MMDEVWMMRRVQDYDEFSIGTMLIVEEVWMIDEVFF